MKNVISIFTKKPLEESQDTKKNDEQSSEGRFAGSIPVVMAAGIRAHQAETEALGEHIDNLVGDYMFMLDEHNDNLDNVIGLLGVKDYDPETQVIMISEDGKVWLVDREQMEPSEGH